MGCFTASPNKLIPSILFSTIASFIDFPRPSTAKIEWKGDRISPCQIPIYGLKVEGGEPFTKIDNKVLNIRE